MTSRSDPSHEEVQGRVRGLLITLAPQLPILTVGLVDEMIDANECGVALEIMSEMLVESGAVISESSLSDVASLVDEMGLDRVNVNRLRSLVSRGAAQITATPRLQFLAPDLLGVIRKRDVPALRRVARAMAELAITKGS